MQPKFQTLEQRGGGKEAGDRTDYTTPCQPGRGLKCRRHACSVGDLCSIAFVGAQRLLQHASRRLPPRPLHEPLAGAATAAILAATAAAATTAGSITAFTCSIASLGLAVGGNNVGPGDERGRRVGVEELSGGRRISISPDQAVVGS
jgi:hypothetical protein